MMKIVLAAGASMVLAGGCGQSRYGSAGPWQWEEPARLSMGNTIIGYDQMNNPVMGNSGSSSAVVVAPGRAGAVSYAYTPEDSRRDTQMSVRSTELGLSMGWQAPARTSLENMRVYYSSSSPHQYVYPSNTPYGGYGYNNSGYGGYYSGQYRSGYSYEYTYSTGSGYGYSQGHRRPSIGQHPNQPSPRVPAKPSRR